MTKEQFYDMLNVQVAKAQDASAELLSKPFDSKDESAQKVEMQLRLVEVAVNISVKAITETLLSTGVLQFDD